MAVKTTAKTTVRKPKKAISAPKTKRTAGSRLDKIDRAILSMTASIAASEAMLAEKLAASDAKIAASIDLFLEGDAEVMVVEVKARFKLGLANTFLRRLESLRKHDVTINLAGKTIYAAIAGISIDDNVRGLALEKGIYLIDIDQDNDKIKIEPPKDAVGKW
jgi:hypothetical protein